MKGFEVKGFTQLKTSGSINLYIYEFTFVNTEDILFPMMANIDYVGALYKYLYFSNRVKPLFCCENAIIQFHGVQYLYNIKTLRKKLWTHFPGSTKNMHLTP